MSNTKFTNQIQLDNTFNPAVSPSPIAIGDSATTIASKTQSALWALGSGTYIGKWDAATNTPPLSNSTVEAGGNWYNVFISTGAPSATVNFGAGPITFTASDAVYSTGSVYAKRDLPDTSITLPDAQILVGQTTGLAAPVPVTGDLTLADTGEFTLAFGARTTTGNFDPTIKGNGVQYFTTNQTIDISTMIVGRKYKLYNSDTALHTITFTGTGVVVIGGDALLVGLVQSVNPTTSYTICLQNATTVLID